MSGDKYDILRYRMYGGVRGGGSKLCSSIFSSKNVPQLCEVVSMLFASVSQHMQMDHLQDFS